MNAAVMANLFAGAREEERLFPPPSPPMTFFLGTHRPHWLRLTAVPLFVSRRVLAPTKALPRALGPWALDSGAFTELSLHGSYRTGAATYAAEARRFRDEVGGMTFCCPQDWMCEPFVVAKTGLSVAEHQRRTVESYLLLRSLEPSLPWAPVLQGWRPGEYLDHAGQYDRAGVDLRALPVVGLGSVCRRSSTDVLTAESIVRELAGLGIRLHAFGLKLTGLRRAAHLLASADSMAWSYGARHSPPLDGCPHRNCANCLRFALRWRERVLKAVEGARASRQGLLF